jgi:hypothetical protein
MVLTDLGTAEHPLRGVFLFVAGADSPAYPRVIFLSKEEKLQGRRRGILQKKDRGAIDLLQKENI